MRKNLFMVSIIAAFAFIFMGCPQPIVELNSIAITKAATKVEYEVGEKLDTTGMEVTAKYSDGTEKVVTGWKTSGFDSSKAAEKQTVTVSYTENEITKTASFDVKIKEAPAEEEPEQKPEDTSKEDEKPEDDVTPTLQSMIDNAEDGSTVDLSAKKLTLDREININKALTITGGKTAFDLKEAKITVKATGVKIENVKNVAEIIVDEAVGEGDFSVVNSDVKKLTANGGGKNSIHIDGTAVEAVAVAKEAVRVVLEGSAKIAAVEVKAACILDSTTESAEIAKVNVAEDVKSVTLAGKVNITAFEAASSDFKIVVASNDVKIQTAVIIAADGTTIAPKIEAASEDIDLSKLDVPNADTKGDGETLPKNVGTNEVAGVTFGNETLKYIFNTDGTVTQLGNYGYNPDPSFERAVYNYSYDSSKKQVVLKAVKMNPGSGLSTCEEMDPMFSEMFLEGKKDQLASLGLPPNTSDEDFLNAMAKADGWDSWEAMQQLMYRAMFTNIYVFSYSDNELKPVFNYSTFKDFLVSGDNNIIFKNSDESVVLQNGSIKIQDEWLYERSFTDTKIKFAYDKGEITYTADLTKPEGQKTVTITWKGTEYTLTQSVISYPKMN